MAKQITELTPEEREQNMLSDCGLSDTPANREAVRNRLEQIDCKGGVTFPDEIPWEDDSQWDHFDFDPFPQHDQDGNPTEGVVILFEFRDGQRFEDQKGRRFTKIQDGPVQGSCVIWNGKVFCQFDGSMYFKEV